MVRWQTIALWLMGIALVSGTVTYVDLFSGLFQLTGVSFAHSGDITCGTECNSTINITTTYWNICFEESKPTQGIYIDIGDGRLTKTTIQEYPDTVLYKKWRYGRKLWVNLNNINNIISTTPEIRVDWLVPTRGTDNWRKLKSGDCWSRLKNNRIKIVGHKDADQAIKWGFNISNYVDIDPIWLSTNKTLNDGSRFTRESPNKITIEKDDVVFNISSDIEIHELGDIRKTKEWEYKRKGSHFEIVKSNKELVILDNYVCAKENQNTINGGRFNQKTIYDSCIYYPPQYVYYEGLYDEFNDGNPVLFNLSKNTMNMTKLGPKTIRIDFLDEYDPLLGNYTIGMIACWPFDSNTVDNFSGILAQNNGAVLNTTELILGGAFYYVSNDYMNFTINANPQNFTIGGWFYADGETGEFDTLFSYGDSSDVRVIRDSTGTNQGELFITVNGRVGFTSSNDQMDLDQYNLVILTSRPGNTTLYLNDGEIFGDNTVADVSYGAGDWKLGARGAGPGLFFNGHINEFYMWNVYMNRENITALFNNSFGVNCSTIIATGEPPAVEDTCSPDSPLTADHNYLPTDNCVVTSDLEAGGNTITCSGGTGTITLKAVISNIKNFFTHKDCDFFCRNTPTCFG